MKIVLNAYLCFLTLVVNALFIIGTAVLCLLLSNMDFGVAFGLFVMLTLIERSAGWILKFYKEGIFYE